MLYIVPTLIGYLLGCSNMAAYLAALRGVDLKSGGTGNPGASNTLILMGWRAGVLVGVHDIGKAVAAVLLAKAFFPGLPLAGAVAGVCSVLGHMFPFYLKFRGGKGFASYLGMTLALNWRFALLLFVIVAAVTLISDYIVIGTMTTVVSVPLFSAWEHHYIAALLLAALSAIIVYKHRMNLVHICDGTEIGFQSAKRGDHRKGA